MIGKFQKYLSARAKQLDTSLWQHFFRIVVLCIKLLGVLWLATASVAVWDGIFSWPLPTQGSWQPCIPVSMYIRSFPWSRGTWWPRCSMSPALLSLSPCSVWELCNHHKATQVSASQHKWGTKQHLLWAGAPKEACVRAGRWMCASQSSFPCY